MGALDSDVVVFAGSADDILGALDSGMAVFAGSTLEMSSGPVSGDEGAPSISDLGTRAKANPWSLWVALCRGSTCDVTKDGRTHARVAMVPDGSEITILELCMHAYI